MGAAVFKEGTIPSVEQHAGLLRDAGLNTVPGHLATPQENVDFFATTVAARGLDAQGRVKPMAPEGTFQSGQNMKKGEITKIGRTAIGGDEGDQSVFEGYYIEDVLVRNDKSFDELQKAIAKGRISDFDPRFEYQDNFANIQTSGIEMALFDLKERFLVDKKTGKKYQLSTTETNKLKPYEIADPRFFAADLANFIKKNKPVDFSSRKTEDMIDRESIQKNTKTGKVEVQADPKAVKTNIRDYAQNVIRDIDRRGGNQRKIASTLLQEDPTSKNLLGE
jgi:hypothetical protein